MCTPTPAVEGVNVPFGSVIPLPDHVPPRTLGTNNSSASSIQDSKSLPGSTIGNGFITRFMVSLFKQFPDP
ncbi:MAG: Uncharacterised protein [Crocinitomicaceae bacterium]|nr:MAG: Uncharacterised protein [Crocinitomicaceae bacterium]